MLELIFPYPPTINHIYSRGKHGVYLKPHVKAYREICYWQLSAFNTKTVISAMATNVINARIKLTIKVYFPDKRRRDLDNILKATLDTLVYCKVIDDDSLIEELHVIKAGYVKHGRLELKIELLS